MPARRRLGILAIMRKRLLIATGNEGKIAELRSMLFDIPLELIGLDHFTHLKEVQETGATFDQNARLKAAGYAGQTGLTALADDSGLEVIALANRPGVLSARYGGAETPFSEKTKLLLDELAVTGDEVRRARFVCSIAIAAPSGEILFSAEGICDGTISQSPRGTHGFGYDPIFIPDGYQATFGELTASVKHEISHRGRAFLQIIPFLRDFSAI